MGMAWARAVWVLSILLGVTLGFSVILQRLSPKVSSLSVGFKLKSRTRLYILSPGVACHELGHCIGAWITGARVAKVVFFEIDEDNGRLGYVRFSSTPGWWGAFQRTASSTGPLWFGCLMIALLSKLLLGSAAVVHVEEFVDCTMVPSVIEYLLGCFWAGGRLLSDVVLGGFVSPIRAILWLYLSYCIASFMGMSPVDLRLMWKGVVLLLVVVLVLAMIPLVGKWVVTGVYLALPVVFTLHAIMAFCIVLSCAMILLFRLVR